MQNIDKMTHEMTDEELAQHEADMKGAAARLFGGAHVHQVDDELDDEPTDESGDLLETISPYDYRTLAEANAE